MFGFIRKKKQHQFPRSQKSHETVRPKVSRSQDLRPDNEILNKLDALMIFLRQHDQKRTDADYTLHQRLANMGQVRKAAANLKGDILKTIAEMSDRGLKTNEIVSRLVETSVCSRATAFRYLAAYRSQGIKVETSQ